jgi:hypothetical protein
MSKTLSKKSVVSHGKILDRQKWRSVQLKQRAQTPVKICKKIKNILPERLLTKAPWKFLSWQKKKIPPACSRKISPRVVFMNEHEAGKPPMVALKTTNSTTTPPILDSANRRRVGERRNNNRGMGGLTQHLPASDRMVI